LDISCGIYYRIRTVYVLTHDSYVTRDSSVIAIEYEYFYFILILLYNFNSIDEEIAPYPIKSIDYSMIFKNCRPYVMRVKI